MHLGDTIVAQAARGAAPAGRAMLRISGPAAFDAAQELLVTPCPRARRVSINRLRAAGLPVVCAAFPAPSSYTGEDVIEVQLPANRTLIQRMLEMLTERDGIRLAGPGEFTARAFLNGRLDAAQAEGVGALVAARSARELRIAHDLLIGRTGGRFREMLDEIVAVLALVEAGIDFTDQEDVVLIAPDELVRRCETVLRAIADLVGDGGTREQHTGRVRAVLMGAPNAGKSTLFNALLGRNRAAASNVPGTTRDVLVELLPRPAPGAWNSAEVELVDVAGVGGSPLSALDRQARGLARAAIERADIILHCDPAGRFEAPAPSAAITLRVRTKADLSSTAPASDALAVCALDGYRIEALREAIFDAAATITNGDAHSAVLARHARALNTAQAALEQVRASHVDDPALVAHHLRAAADALGEIGGRINPDDVLGRIFASFCVGK